MATKIWLIVGGRGWSHDLIMPVWNTFVALSIINAISVGGSVEIYHLFCQSNFESLGHYISILHDVM